MEEENNKIQEKNDVQDQDEIKENEIQEDNALEEENILEENNTLSSNNKKQGRKKRKEYNKPESQPHILWRIFRSIIFFIIVFIGINPIFWYFINIFSIIIASILLWRESDPAWRRNARILLFFLFILDIIFYFASGVLYA
ncbi:MAG: hypothetical protein GY870_02570 [archaeon]|nr:hypothetical protein [archaeon]